MDYHRTMRFRLSLTVAAGILAAAPMTVGTQTMSRTATTLAAITRYPAFYHDKVVALVGTPVEMVEGALTGLPLEAPRQFVIAPKSGRVPLRPLELRGRLLDIGRFASDDSRLGPLDVNKLITLAAGDRWPARERLLILHGTTWIDRDPVLAPTMRNLALQPERLNGQTVVVRGRFRGRNLFGDLPAWPRQSEWDFVLQTADAAVWVVGKRPRGDGFDLTTTTRTHTGRWLEVTGSVKIVDGLALIVADRLRAAEPEAEPVPEEDPAPVLPSPEVIFSAPAQDETGIARDVLVRLQFSRPLRPGSLQPNIRIRYADGVTETLPSWTATYRPGPMAVEIRFEAPLAGGVGVIVELGAGIQAPDGVGLTPMTLRFTTSAGLR